MGRIHTIFAGLVVGLFSAARAHAVNSVALPDPSGATLFTLGIAGLLIGRSIAGKRRD